MIKSYIDFFFSQFNNITTAFLVVGCLISYIRYIRNNISLDNLISKSLGYTMFPTSCALFICAFDKSYIGKLADIHLSLCVAAVAIFYVAFKSIK